MKILLILFCVLIMTHPIAAQEDSASIVLKPQRLLLPPLQSALNEPNLGLAKSLSSSEMKVDIGNGMDLLRYHTTTPGGGARTIAVGIDFFTFVKIIGWEGLRLQVDAVDGFFGGHIATVVPLGSDALQLRFRFIHLSAHYVDGHYSIPDGAWKNDRLPVPFTRDMGDWMAAYVTGDVRVYALVEHAFRIRPFNQRRTWYEGGVEWYFLTTGSSHLLLGHDIKLVGWDAYTPVYTTTLAWTFGGKYGSGITFFLRHYAGVGPYSEYIDTRTSSFNAGFSIGYW